MKPGRNPWSFFMQKNNENLGKTMSMVKVITISTWITFMCLCYLAVKNGLDLFTGIALITNIVSNVINMIYLLKEKE